jgi:dTDP-4-dehydrorhamnose reductase
VRVGVTGAAGMLGATLVPVWREAGAEVFAWDVQDFDITDASAALRAVREAGPDLVVHLAAYTAVDRAEDEPELALRVNGEGTANVARAARAAGASLAYLSTDYVFGGSGRSPIRPEEAPRPVGAYARGKAAGEMAVREAGGEWLILRSGWLYGPGGVNFVDTMKGRALAGQASRVVDDQIGAPTSARVVTEVLWALVRSGARGVWHGTAAGAVSWFEVARLVYEASGANADLVTPCTTRELGRPAPRPAYSVLDCRATERRLGTGLPAWDHQVRAYVSDGVLAPAGIMAAARAAEGGGSA